MEQRTFGWTGIRLPVIGQGTWQMESDPRAACIEALRRGLDAGMTHIDTAELYGSGVVEEIVGDAIAGRREQVFLASKVLPHNASYEGTLAACERSLRRLRTEQLDLYLLHWAGHHPLQETFRAFERLVEQGKIRLWGVSNFDEQELERAVAIAGPKRIACNQVLYHLEERAIEHRVIPACAAHDIAVVGYSPFGSGAFPGERPAGPRGRGALRTKSPGPSTPGRRVLDEIARAHGATARQVALRFLCRLPGTFTIPKASKVAHVLDNAAAGDLQLTEDDLRRIDAAFPLGPDRGELPVL